MKATAASLAAASITKGAVKPKEVWPFYAFDNGLRGKGLESLDCKCRLLKDLGYKGLQYHMNPKEMPKMYESLDKYGLKMFGMYVVLNLSDGPVDKKLAESIKLMKGRDTNIDLGIRTKKFKRSDPAGDKIAREMLKKIVDLCGDTGPKISIYPHAGFWTERCEDGARLAKLVDPKMVGTMFNLVHWQWVKPCRPIPEVLKENLPHIRSVTFNGLKGDSQKKQKIMPLDESDHDIEKFLTMVKDAGYTGSIGLQCYSIKAPPQDHLKRSMAKFMEIKKKLF